MCLIMTLITKEELSKEIILKFSTKDIYLNRLDESNQKLAFGKDINIYTLTNGMCSCDFFRKTSNEKKLNRYYPYLKELLGEIYSLGIHFKLFLHDYRGGIDSEKLIVKEKSKITLDELISKFTQLEENVLYICV
ncbi:MAG: hypothetical protein A2Y23_09825 [Clostridiales bacterium GWB2_37_7]|nr:MAG: hypothetical protein A2Y23_09825 [Clostridiales bacterium GWB2_37_7]